MLNISIISSNPECINTASILSDKLGYPVYDGNLDDCNSPLGADSYVLLVDEYGVSLVQPGISTHGPIKVDFSSGRNNHRRKYGGGNGQMIAKAVGISGRFKPSIMDLTAGLGADGFIFASLGCNVKLIERNPLIASLLQDGILRANADSKDDSDLASIMEKLVLIESDSFYLMSDLTEDEKPDVIYLDPMFPHRKKTAKVKKEMQAFQAIVGDDNDSGLLLDKAIDTARYRVVIKRPNHAEYLHNMAPTYSLSGKSIRFDIFAKKKMLS
jgi:16S rRNA (guanine1516-N2)-methyltransferase